jgi:hypothetical protein
MYQGNYLNRKVAAIALGILAVGKDAKFEHEDVLAEELAVHESSLRKNEH